VELSLPEEAVVALPGVAEPRLVVVVLPLPEEAEQPQVVEVELQPEAVEP